MKLPISVFIIAKNEEDRIPLTIKSVRDWVDEVIVIDSGSADRTVAVSEELGAKAVFRAWEGYGPQKVFGESLCRNDWLLNLDADEEVSPALAQEIQALFARGEPAAKGYRLRILALYRFQRTLPLFAAGTAQTRLYHRAFGGFKSAYVHDTVLLKAGYKARSLRAPVVHRCFRSHAHAVAKINDYSGMQAEDLFRKGRNPSCFKLVLTPPLAFAKSYFFRRYMFYGVDGVMQSYMYAFSRFLRLAKARERFQEAGQTDSHAPDAGNASEKPVHAG